MNAHNQKNSASFSPKKEKIPHWQKMFVVKHNF
jgi:hypothetical protein